MIKDTQINNNHFPQETLSKMAQQANTVIATQALEPEFHAQKPWWKERTKSVPKSCFLTSTCLPAHVCTHMHTPHNARMHTISFLGKYVICTVGNLNGESIKL